MAAFHERVLALIQRMHPLDRIARAGYVLRGVTEPENVSAHSHFVAVMTLLFVDEYPEKFDRAKALTMALLHDLPEAALMDIPMPAGHALLREAKHVAEREIAADMFHGMPLRYVELLEELKEAKSAEARLVRGLDTAQMMIKVLCYERERRGNLEEFWHNPLNFDDNGLSCVSDLFDALCAAAARVRPTSA